MSLTVHNLATLIPMALDANKIFNLNGNMFWYHHNEKELYYAVEPVEMIETNNIRTFYSGVDFIKGVSIQGSREGTGNEILYIIDEEKYIKEMEIIRKQKD